jgi:cytochrome P450
MFMDPLQETNVGDVRVGPEVGVVALTRLAGLHPDYFSDGERFLPERWLREDTDVRERCPVHETRAAMGFGGGPRICPGRGLAMLEIHAVMSTLARSFDVEAVSDPDEVREHFAFTMSPEGLRVRVRRRTDAD